MKRCVSLICCLLFVFSLFAVPAAAETIEDIYDPNEIFGSYYLIEPTVFNIADKHIDEVSGLSFLKQYFIFDTTYASAPSFPFAATPDESEDAFWDLFGFAEWIEEVYSVSFNGTLYEDLRAINYQCADGTVIQFLGNPVLFFGDLRDDPSFNEHFGHYDNGLPFLFILTLDLPNVLASIITDGIYGNVEVSVVCGIVPDVESLDYNDYVSNTVISDDLQTVTVTLPAAYSSTYVRTGDMYESFKERYLGPSFVHDFDTVGVDNYVQHALFGSPIPISGFGYRGKALYVGNIPDGTVLNFTFSMRMKADENWLYEPEEWGLSFRSAQIAEPGVITRGDVSPYEVVEMERDGDYFVMTVKCTTTLDNLNADTKWMSFDCGFGVGVVQSERRDVMFNFKDVELEFSISALAGMVNETQRNNKLLKEVSQQLADQGKTLDEIEDLLGGYVNGDHGFDSSGSDFSGAVNDLQDSSTQMNNAMSGGSLQLDNMMSAPAMTVTLSALAAGFDAVFKGHEVTICGVTANPFELVVSVGSFAVLLPLGLKLIFRKWGSGGSGGGSDG